HTPSYAASAEREVVGCRGTGHQSCAPYRPHAPCVGGGFALVARLVAPSLGFLFRNVSICGLLSLELRQSPEGINIRGQRLGSSLGKREHTGVLAGRSDCLLPWYLRAPR